MKKLKKIELKNIQGGIDKNYCDLLDEILLKGGTVFIYPIECMFPDLFLLE